MDKTELRKDIKIKSPTIHHTVFVADGAKVVGNVTLKKGSSIWYNTVARADINKIIITDTICIPKHKLIDKLKIMSVSGIFGQAVDRVHNGESVSALFEY